jgi:hypothetical protein
VVVAADTSGEAALVASEAARDPDAPNIGNESDTYRCGFEDEKLYVIRRIPEDEQASYAADPLRHGVVLAVPMEAEA